MFTFPFLNAEILGGTFLVAAGGAVIALKTFRPHRWIDFIIALFLGISGAIFLIEGIFDQEWFSVHPLDLLLLLPGLAIYLYESFHLRAYARKPLSKIEKAKRVEAQKRAFIHTASKLTTANYWSFWRRWIFGSMVMFPTWWSILLYLGPQTGSGSPLATIIIVGILCVFNLYFLLALYQLILLRPFNVSISFLWPFLLAVSCIVSFFISFALHEIDWIRNLSEPIRITFMLGLGWTCSGIFLQILMLRRYFNSIPLIIWVLSNSVAFLFSSYLCNGRILSYTFGGAFSSSLSAAALSIIDGMIYGFIFSLITGCAFLWMLSSVGKREGVVSSSPKLGRIFAISLALLVSVSTVSQSLTPESIEGAVQDLTEGSSTILDVPNEQNRPPSGANR